MKSEPIPAHAPDSAALSREEIAVLAAESFKPKSFEPELSDSEPSEPTIEPCEHMKEYVSALSDDTLRGPARWYTQLHASYCGKCGPALKSLRHLRARLNRLRRENAERESVLSEERRQAVQQAMEATDASHSS